MKISASWIQGYEGVSIISLAGSGKSNLLALVNKRPEVMKQYLTARRLGWSWSW
jgi:hypothetical protein